MIVRTPMSSNKCDPFNKCSPLQYIASFLSEILGMEQSRAALLFIVFFSRLRLKFDLSSE